MGADLRGHAGPTTIEVVLCTYNGAAYLQEQIDSILSQTRSPTRLSIYDDASTDGTCDIVHSIMRGTTGGIEVVLSVNPVNLGYARNFEQAIRKSRCDFVALCDQDDIWHPDKLDTLMAAFDADTGVVFSNALLVDAQGTSLDHTLWEVIRLTERRKAAFAHREAARRLLLQQNYVTGAALMMRRSLVAALPPFPAGAPHDYWLALVAAEVSALRPVDQPLYRYRQHASNAIGQKPAGTLRRVVNAIQASRGRYEKELETYRQLALALQGHADLRLAGQGIQDKAAFLQCRLRAVGSGWRGWTPLARLLFAGDYRRFCRTGAAMFIKDICVLASWSWRGMDSTTPTNRPPPPTSC